MRKEYTIKEKNFDMQNFRLNQIMIAAIAVSIPLFAQIIDDHSSWSEVIFFFLLLVVIISISRQLDTIKQQILKLENINTDVISLQQDVQKLISKSESFQTLLESHLNLQIELVNRDKSSSKEGYKKIFELIRTSKRSIKTICHRKSRNFIDSSRGKFLQKTESLIQEKTKKNKGFSYKRIIPVPGEISHENMLQTLNFQTLSHCKRLALQYRKSTTIGCRSVEEVSIPMNFIMIDNTYLIVLLPKLAIKHQQILQDDECAFHLVIKDKKGTFIRSIERQFDLLYHNGKAIYNFHSTLN